MIITEATASKTAKTAYKSYKLLWLVKWNIINERVKRSRTRHVYNVCHWSSAIQPFCTFTEHANFKKNCKLDYYYAVDTQSRNLYNVQESCTVDLHKKLVRLVQVFFSCTSLLHEQNAAVLTARNWPKWKGWLDGCVCCESFCSTVYH